MGLKSVGCWISAYYFLWRVRHGPNTFRGPLQAARSQESRFDHTPAEGKQPLPTSQQARP